MLRRQPSRRNQISGIAHVGIRCAGCPGAALGAAANVIRVEALLAHIPMLRQRSELFPRVDERIAQHGVLHQPQTERQHELAARTGGDLRIHDDQAATRRKLIPGAAQHRAMIRHGVVRQAEQHTIKRRRRRECGGIALHQFDIVPTIGVAGPLRLAQHAGRNIDAVNAAARTYRFVQITETSAGAAADIEHPIAGGQSKTIDRSPARILRQKENPVEKRNKRCQTVISSADGMTVAIDPLIHH
jgi:hypothetical protein